MARVRVGRIQPASCHTWVPSPPQKLVKSISQLKDLQDVFLFRYNTQARGRHMLKGGRGTASCWEAEGGREQQGKVPEKRNHLWLHLSDGSSTAMQSYRVWLRDSE